MKEYKVGIVGYGGMGSYHHGNINELGGALKVVAAFDTDSDRTEFIKNSGIQSAESFDSLLKLSDVILIATPNDSHMDYAVQAAKSGKHIICEKPAAMSAEQYGIMAKSAQKEGVILAVHQNRRWDRDYLTAKNIIESGILGRVYRINSSVMAANGIPGGWRKKLYTGGGMMLDWGVHLIDQAALMYNFNALSCTYSYVFGHEVEDGFTLTLRRESKTGENVAQNISQAAQNVTENAQNISQAAQNIGESDKNHKKYDLEYNICVDTNTFTRQPRWQIYGTQGSAVIDDWDCGGKIVIMNGIENCPVAITAGNGLTKTMADRNALSVTEMEITPVSVPTYPFYNMFINALCGKGSTITHEQVLNVLKLMEKAAKIAINIE